MHDTINHGCFQNNEVLAFLRLVAKDDHTSCIVADDEYQQERYDHQDVYNQLADNFHAVGKEGAQWPDVKSGAQWKEHLKSLKSTYYKLEEESGNGKSKWMFYEQMKRIFDIRARHKKLENDKLRASRRHPLHSKSADAQYTMCDTKSYDRFQDNEVSAFLSFVATNDHTSCIVADDEYQQEDDNEYDQLADKFHAIGKEGGSAQWPDVKSGAQWKEHLKSLKSTYDKVKEGSGNGRSKWMFYEQMKIIFGNGRSKWMFYEQMKIIFDIRARHKKLENDKLRATGRRPLHPKSAGHDETDAAGRGSPHQNHREHIPAPGRTIPTYSHFELKAFGFGLILLVAALVFTFFPWSALYGQQQQAGTIVVNSSNIGQLVRERLTPVLASQDQVFWDILDSELTYLVSKDNPKYQPMCLTMRARRLDGNSPEASFECINKVINSLLGGSTKVLTLSGGRILDDKSDFEDSVTSHWEAGDKVTTILDFNKMSFSSALLLYKLCDDNDKPAFPGTVVLLTIEDDDSTLDDFSWMSKKLERDWKDNSAELNPLLTRIANNVVKFNPELRTDC